MEKIDAGLNLDQIKMQFNLSTYAKIQIQAIA